MIFSIYVLWTEITFPSSKLVGDHYLHPCNHREFDCIEFYVRSNHQFLSFLFHPERKMKRIDPMVKTHTCYSIKITRDESLIHFHYLAHQTVRFSLSNSFSCTSLRFSEFYLNERTITLTDFLRNNYIHIIYRSMKFQKKYMGQDYIVMFYMKGRNHKPLFIWTGFCWGDDISNSYYPIQRTNRCFQKQNNHK